MWLYLMKIIYSVGTGWGELQVANGAERRQQTPEGLWGARLDEGAAAGSGQEWMGARDAEGKWTKHKDMQSLGVGLRRRAGLETSDWGSSGKTFFLSLFGPRSIEN